MKVLSSFRRFVATGSRLSLVSLALIALAAVPASHGADASGVELEGPQAAAIYARLNAASGEMPIVAIRPAAAGLYAVELADASAYYATADGSHLIAGDLYAVLADGFANRTEDLRATRRIEMIDEVSRDDMIVFSPDGETRGVVNVFTDVDCGFCQRLHREVPALNEMGVEVRYLAYPRAGIGSGSMDKLVSAWCAEDPRVALTRLKTGKPVEPRSCANPVASQYRLGQRMGVRGTPALFLEDGRMLPGYMPAAALAAELGLAPQGALGGQ
jgi:thiol:disulfide interchange protein DsbC